MARKSIKKISNNNNNLNTSMKRKSSRSKKKTAGNKGGKLGAVDLTNLENNKFWCMKCGRKNKATGIVQGKDVTLETTKNGRKALRGKCAGCDCNLYRFC